MAAARLLPVRRSLSQTLKLWSRHLAGFDIHREFVTAARLRLAILALSRGARFDLNDLRQIAAIFSEVRHSDGFRALQDLEGITHVLINPPFGSITAPKGCSWGEGRVSKAAVFFERCLYSLKSGTHVTAILPDVLRAGSRYEKWRNMVREKAAGIQISQLGNFRTADVDVFLLKLLVRSRAAHTEAGGSSRSWLAGISSDTVGARFEISVGAVVPHRLRKQKGRLHKFIHAKNLPAWGIFDPVSEKISFSGQVTLPPFVVIRRTSGPADHWRALATLIVGKKQVAVENHLIVCKPKSGGKRACSELLKKLKTKSTNRFLNKRIRCRHLTVGAVKEIPW